jgi:hypothetical protein
MKRRVATMGAIFVGLAPLGAQAKAAVAEDAVFTNGFDCAPACRFDFLAEISGTEPAPWASVLATWYGFSGFGFWAPMSAASRDYLANTPFALMAYMPAANRSMSHYNYVYDPAQIPALEADLRGLAAASADPGRIRWDGMPEFDPAIGRKDGRLPVRR